MFRFNTENIRKKYETGMKKAENAVEVVKDITVHPTLDAAFEIKSKKKQKNLFDMRVRFDKELSLCKIIWVCLAAIAVVGAISAAMDMLFSCRKNGRSEMELDD